MRSLTLLRHAEAGSVDAITDDFDRPLNERGRCAAQGVGRHLAAKRVRIDRVLASPAQRVVETLQGLTASGWEAGRVKFDPLIYHASTDELLAMLRSTPGDVERLMLVGHNPVLAMLAVQLTLDDDEGLRARVAERYPAGALAEIALDIEDWSEAAAQCGRLVEFIEPPEA